MHLVALWVQGMPASIGTEHLLGALLLLTQPHTAQCTFHVAAGVQFKKLLVWSQFGPIINDAGTSGGVTGDNWAGSPTVGTTDHIWLPHRSRGFRDLHWPLARPCLYSGSPELFLVMEAAFHPTASHISLRHRLCVKPSVAPHRPLPPTPEVLTDMPSPVPALEEQGSGHTECLPFADFAGLSCPCPHASAWHTLCLPNGLANTYILSRFNSRKTYTAKYCSAPDTSSPGWVRWPCSVRLRPRGILHRGTYKTAQ